jgi:hypothetical protein
MFFLGKFVGHISEKIRNIFDGQIQISINPFLCRPSVKIYFPAEFQVRSNLFMFSSQQSLPMR